MLPLITQKDQLLTNASVPEAINLVNSKMGSDRPLNQPPASNFIKKQNSFVAE